MHFTAIICGVPRKDVLFLRELLKLGRNLVVATTWRRIGRGGARCSPEVWGEDVSTARKNWETRVDRAARIDWIVSGEQGKGLR